MGTKEDKLNRNAELRAKAEAKLEGALKKVDDIPEEKMKDVKSLIHEVQVFSIELELQNQELLETQNNLENYKDKLEELFEFAPVGYLIISEDGVIHNANLTICSLLKVDRRNIINKKLYSFQEFTSDKDILFKELREHFATDKKSSFEIDFIDSEGNKLNTLVGIAGIEKSESNKKECRVSISDITQLKKAELEKERLEKRFQTITELTSDYTYEFKVHKNQQLELEWISGAFEKITGFTPEESEERGGWAKLIYPEDLPVAQERARKLFNSQEDESEFRIVCKDGSIKWIRDDGKPLIENGKLVGVIGGAKDITIEKEREYELKQNYSATLNLVEDLSNEIDERKKAESNLKESQAFLSTLLESIPIPVFYKNIEVKYKGVNRAFEEFFGAKQTALLGKSVFEIHPKELAEIYHENDKSLLENGGTQEYESEVKTSNGEIRNVIFNKAVYHDNSGNIIGLIGTILDVTEERKSRKELKESEEKYRGIFENTLTGILVADDKGNYLTINQAAADILGYSIDELVKMSVADLQTKSQPGAVERYKKYLSIGKETGEFDFIRKDGEERIAKYHAVRIKPDFNISLMNDITEEKKVQIALKESEENYRVLAESSQDIILVHDLDGKISYANNSFLELIDLEKEKIIGSSITVLLKEKQQREFQKNLSEFIKSTEKSLQFELTFYHDDGNEIILDARATKLEQEEIKKSILLVCRDVTKRKLEEEKIRKLSVAAGELTESRATDDIFDFTVNKVYELLNNQGIVIATTTNKNTFQWKVESILGLGKNTEKVLKIIGMSPEKLSGHTNAEYLSKFEPGKLFHVGEELDQTVALSFSSKISKKLKSLLGFDSIYTIQINLDRNIYLNLSILTSTKTHLDNETIEIFIQYLANYTQRIAITKEIQESEEKYRGIIENSLSGIFVADDKGNYLTVNQAAADMLGYSIDELEKMNVADLQTKSQPGAVERYKKYLQTGRETGEFDFIRKDGEERIAKYHAVRIKPDFNISLMNDITGEKNAEDLLNKRMQELEMLNKVMVGRENRMIELKEEINELCTKLGQPQKYRAPDDSIK